MGEVVRWGERWRGGKTSSGKVGETIIGGRGGEGGEVVGGDIVVFRWWELVSERP